MKTIEFRKELIDNLLTCITRTWFTTNVEAIEKDFSWIINKNVKIDVKGKVEFFYYPGSKLPFKFGTVDGGFYCAGGNITTMENFPDIVYGDFCCSCDKITSLDNLPKIVTGDMFCQPNGGLFNEEDIRKDCKVDGTINIQYF